jgi:putative transposase
MRDLGEMQVWEEHGQWHGSIVLRDPAPRPAGATEGAIGINRGVVHFATLSNGERLEGFAGEPELEKWRLHRERGASRRFRVNNQNNVNRAGRRLPGRRLVRSNSERKVRNKVGKLSAALARMRREELHLIANDLLDGYHTICLEDLDIQQMTRSAHGTIDDPGSEVARRTRLNRRILEKAWGEFARILEYKAEERGNRVVRVDPKYISRQCPECGVILDRNPSEHTRVFSCPNCGHVEDVDVIAARNVLARGLSDARGSTRGKSHRAPQRASDRSSR